MASEGGAGLLPIPCCSRELDSVAHLLAARLPIVAECSSSSQSTRPGALGTFVPRLVPVDSATPCSASVSSCPLRRHSSSVRAVCVNALARICAGGDQRCSSLPRQLAAWRSKKGVDGQLPSPQISDNNQSEGCEGCVGCSSSSTAQSELELESNIYNDHQRNSLHSLHTLQPQCLQ